MIIKSFDLKRLNIRENNFILLHGKNEGHKNQVIELFSREFPEILNYEENQII